MDRGLLRAWCLAIPGLALGGPPPAGDHLFVVTSDPDTGTGNCAAIELEPPWSGSVDLEVTGPDTIVRHFLGRHYVVHRLSGEIQVIDPQTFDTVLQFSVGAGSRPQDILVVGPGSAYVTRQASPLLYEVDPSTGGVLDEIDLGVFADADGIPEMSMMARDRYHLFVQIQRLDAAALPVPPSYLAVIDLRTNEIVDVDPGEPGVQAIRLTGVIPKFKMQVEAPERRLYVSEPGLFHDGAGGIEAIDLDALTALGFITTEAQNSLDLTGFVLTSPDRGYAITHTDLVLSSHLQPFSRIDGSGLGPELHVSFSQVDSIAYDPATDRIYFPDPDADGVRVFDATTQEELARPVPTGLAPVDLVIARAGTPGEAGDLQVAPPDPASGALSLTFAPACGAGDHHLVFGPLQDVGAYGYSGQVCGIGAVGLFEGFDPGAGSWFFLVVGDDAGAAEGSYGLASSLAERPEYVDEPLCPFLQDLSRRCDP